MSPLRDEVRYQVFVSSTFTDLKEEREKVLQALLECKAFPTGMELFPSADEEQFEFIKREIESSDYYVVIIAGRYGSVADDGVGYTEKEYDYAMSIGKPVLAFLHNDIGQLPGSKLETSDDGRRRLERFRNKVKGRRLVQFYANPDDLKAKVLHSLVQQFQVKPMRGWVRAGETSRSDLERIADLQQQVLELSREVSQLRSLRDESAEAFEVGKQLVSWNIDLSDLAVDLKEPVQKSLEVSGTWDELLLVVFPGGSSYRRTSSVRKEILGWILTKISNEIAPKVQGKALAKARAGDLDPVNAVYNDLHRQFTGLGLIDEIRETEYQSAAPYLLHFEGVVSSSTPPPPKPVTVTRWRLTRRGEHHIAKLAGFLRTGADPSVPAERRAEP